MVMFDDIEDIFKNVREFNDYSKALVTLATATGTLFLIFYAVKLIFQLFIGFRLYILSQFCCRSADYTRKYGEWAVVTGSTDGIGQSMAKELAKRGHSIVVIGRNDEKLARTKAALEAEPNVGEVLTLKIDLSDSSPQNYERIRLALDPDNRDIGVLVNNAGVITGRMAMYSNHHMEDILGTVNVNVVATLYFTRMILPGMLKRGRGLVLNVSSTFGYIPSAYMHVYASTKAFLNSLSRSLQMEYSDHPIDIICLTPGAVHTKLFTALAQREHKASILHPTPDDYARSALNAASTRIKFFCGTIVHGLSKIGASFIYDLGLLHFVTKIAFRMQGIRIEPAENGNSGTDAQENPEDRSKQQVAGS